MARAFIAEGVAAGRPGGDLVPEHPPLGASARSARCYAGATLVPVSTRFTGHEALDVISRSGARALLVAGPFLGTDRLAALRAAASRRRA